MVLTTMVEMLRTAVAPSMSSKRIMAVAVVMTKDLIEDVILSPVPATPVVTAPGMPMRIGRLAPRTPHRR
mgnify:CR=1 FL=1